MPLSESGEARRRFLIETGAVTTFAATTLAASRVSVAATAERVVERDASTSAAAAQSSVDVRLTINDREMAFTLDPRVTLLDLLREHAGLTGTKKGCDHGQCGACTVLVEGRRENSCLSLAASHDGHRITTVEGLARGDTLHPVQAAFLAHDAFQCGYCTPGQICSAVALGSELAAGTVSAVTADVTQAGAPPLTDDEIRERMSGNICRCGAYVNIVAAVRESAGKTGTRT